MTPSSGYPARCSAQRDSLGKAPARCIGDVGHGGPHHDERGAMWDSPVWRELCPSCGEPGELRPGGAQPHLGRSFDCVSITCRVQLFHEYPPEGGA
jgi:hypothetical protein